MDKYTSLLREAYEHRPVGGDYPDMDDMNCLARGCDSTVYSNGEYITKIWIGNFGCLSADDLRLYTGMHQRLSHFLIENEVDHNGVRIRAVHLPDPWFYDRGDGQVVGVTDWIPHIVGGNVERPQMYAPYFAKVLYQSGIYTLPAVNVASAENGKRTSDGEYWITDIAAAVRWFLKGCSVDVLMEMRRSEMMGGIDANRSVG